MYVSAVEHLNEEVDEEGSEVPAKVCWSDGTIEEVPTDDVVEDKCEEVIVVADVKLIP